ncbi:MAG TPA: glutamate synthase subunit beta [Lachnospiraceae bacterium]|nr:glutamate synthase subunit beta [Lachnospiraceae bacterium]
MGKPTGFMEYSRETAEALTPSERIKNFNEFHIPLPREKQQEQGARCMECGVPFCQAGMTLMGMTSGCPLHNLVPEWNDLVYTGNWKQAYNRLMKTNNFPEFTSRVCPALCEAACTCGLNDTPVASKENEYAIIENAYAEGYAQANPPKVRTGKKIAVVGSGPSGLAAADQLNKRGHSVTVYERADRPGGLLMYGIPNMKLEKHIIERKVKIMEEEGVVFRTGVDVGAKQEKADIQTETKIAAKTLLKEFDRVILACGAANPRDIKVPGRDAEGIYFAVDFLKSTTKALLDARQIGVATGVATGEEMSATVLAGASNITAKGKHVIIIGGGDTGNDCVGTSIRHGALSVTQIEMMPKAPDSRADNNPWPQWPKVCKTNYGQEEAIDLFGHDPRIYETTVKEFKKDAKGNVKEVVTVKLEWKKDATTGRMQMNEIQGSKKTLKADLVLIAAGFLGAQKYVADAFGVELNERTNVRTEPETYQTSAVNVFTAGDMHRGQSLVVWAIREGREAARAVDEDLMGYSNLDVQ